MPKKQQKIDLKEIKYEVLDDVQYTVKGDIVTIVREHNHWIQNFFRKLHFKLPEKSYLDFDEFGSFVFLKVKQKEDAYQIGQELGEKYDEANDMLYERLLVFLNHLEKEEKLIQKV